MSISNEQRRFDEFLKNIKEIAELAKKRITEEKRRLENVEYSKAEAKHLQEQIDIKKAYEKYLKDLKSNKPGPEYNTPTADLANFARSINKNLQKNIEEFEDRLKDFEPQKGLLPYVDLEDKDKEELAREISFKLDEIQLDIEKLELIAEMSANKFTRYAISGKQHNNKELPALEEALFQNNSKDNAPLITRFRRFFEDTLVRIGNLVQNVFRQAPVAEIKSVDELFQLNRKTINEHYKGAEKYTKETIKGKLGLEQHKKHNPERDKQINMFSKTIESLKSDKKVIDEIDKIRSRGCLLVLKHQIENEWNLFDSRLLAVVDSYLKTPGLNVGKSAKECIEAFDSYANTKTAELGIDSKMQEKINKTLADENWLKLRDKISDVRKARPE